jgi:hypothetical protein
MVECGYAARRTRVEGQAMWRGIISALLIYSFGAPLFEGYRPPLLDRPLRTFHLEINYAARTGQYLLTRLDEQQIKTSLRLFVDRVEAELRARD